MGISDTSMLMKIAIPLGLVAFLFDLIGLASPYWYTLSTQDASLGIYLWQYCTQVNKAGSSASGCITLPDLWVNSEIKASQAFNVLGFLVGGAAVVLIILYIFCLTNKKAVRLIGMIAAFVAAGLILIGVIIIGTTDLGKLYDVGWAMILAIIGALLYIATGVLMVVDVVQNK